MYFNTVFKKKIDGKFRTRYYGIYFSFLVETVLFHAVLKSFLSKKEKYFIKKFKKK